MYGQPLLVRAEIHESDVDPGRLEQLTLWLRRELQAVDSVDVTLQATTAPTGAKAPGAIEVGTLLVTAAGASVKAIVEVLTRWASQGRERQVKLTCGDLSLELSAASKEEQRELVTEWIKQCHSLASSDARQGG